MAGRPAALRRGAASGRRPLVLSRSQRVELLGAVSSERPRPGLGARAVLWAWAWQHFCPCPAHRRRLSVACASQWETLFFARCKGGHRDPRASGEPGHMPHGPRRPPSRLPAGVSPRGRGGARGRGGEVLWAPEVAPVPHMAVPPPALRGRKCLVRVQRTGPSITSSFGKPLDSVCCAFLNNTVFHLEEQGSVWKAQESRSETRLFSGHSPAVQRFCVLSQVLVLKNPFETEWQQRARLAGSSPLPLGGLLPLRMVPLAAPGSGRRSAGPVLNLTGCTSSSLASFASHRVRLIDTAQVSSCLEMMF